MKIKVVFLAMLVLAAVTLSLPAEAYRQEESSQEAEKELLDYLSADEYFRDATQLMLEKKYDGAKESFNKALEILPEHTEAKLCLGIAEYKTEDYQSALDNIQAAIEEYPSWHEFHFKMETAHYHYAQARITELDNQLLTLLGRELYESFRGGRLRDLHNIPTSDAARVLTIEHEVTDMKEILLPKHSKLVIPALYYFHCGNCLLKLKKFNEAFGEYTKAIEVDPKHGDSHNNLAYLYFLAKRYEESWKHLQLAKKNGAEVNPKVEEMVKQALQQE